VNDSVLLGKEFILALDQFLFLAQGPGAELAINLLVGLVFGGICAAIASGRGRSAVGWFFIGTIFSCFALIVLLVISDLKVEAEKTDRLRRENKRLKERIDKDRQVADQRHENIGNRLDVHDKGLGIDTSLRDSASGLLPAGEPTDEGDPQEESDQWYYRQNHGASRPFGPITFEKLKRLWQKQQIDIFTKVRKGNNGEWMKIRDITGFEDSLNE
jgi:uncharacterized membrane protein